LLPDFDATQRGKPAADFKHVFEFHNSTKSSDFSL
jgi:hypothetical protein